MHSKQWHYSLHRDLQNCYSTRRSPTGFFKLQFQLQFQLQFYTCTLHLQSREFSIQNPILHAEDKELFEYYYYIQRAKDLHSRKEIHSTHRRQGDLLEMHPCVLQDLPVVPDIPVVPDTPETFQAFQSFMTFQPFQAILQCSSISRESTPFQHSLIRMHVLHILHILQFDWFPQKAPPSTSWAITDITNIHSSKKGRCCDIGQIDIFSRIELFPLSSCQVIILIARMTFNCSTSCLMN